MSNGFWIGYLTVGQILRPFGLKIRFRSISGRAKKILRPNGLKIPLRRVKSLLHQYYADPFGSKTNNYQFSELRVHWLRLAPIFASFAVHSWMLIQKVGVFCVVRQFHNKNQHHGTPSAYVYYDAMMSFFNMKIHSLAQFLTLSLFLKAELLLLRLFQRK